MDTATAPISSEAVSAGNTRAPAAAWNTTKANSPPCASSRVNTGRSASGMPMGPAMPQITRPLSTSNASTISAITPGERASTPKSMLMPTAMKNRPSSSP